MLKIEKFTDVCNTGGMHYTSSHTNVCKFHNFQVTADISPEMLKLGRVTKVKVLFLVLVFIFNFDLLKFSAAILEKGLLTGKALNLCYRTKSMTIDALRAKSVRHNSLASKNGNSITKTQR